MRRENKAKIILLILSGFLSFCLISFFYATFSLTNRYALMNSLFYSLGKLSGLAGFLFLSLLIISGDTARFFDRYFGMDRIIRFQRKFALTTTIFVLAHPLFFILSSGTYSNYLIPDFAAPPLAAGIVSLYIYVVVMAASVLYKKVSYQLWQYIHILIYVLFFFSLYHALNIGSDTSNTFVKLAFGVLFIGIIAGGIYRTYYKIKYRKFKCHVKNIKWETHNVFTLKLKCSKKMPFKPGQFCFLRLNKDRLYARHPFTVSNSPNEDTLDFTMRITGRFTKISSQLKEGEEVIVDGPFGIFTIGENEKDLIFIAGGVGITPFMSIIRSHLHSGKKDKKQGISLLYGSRTEEEIIFKKELDEIKENWFKKVYVLSEEEISKQGYDYGFITNGVIEKYAEKADTSLFYVCGPEPMKDKVVKMLKRMGVKKQNIRIESFFW